MIGEWLAEVSSWAFLLRVKSGMNNSLSATVFLIKIDCLNFLGAYAWEYSSP